MLFGCFDNVALAGGAWEEAIKSGAGFDRGVIFSFGVAFGTSDGVEGVFAKFNKVDFSSGKGRCD
jgi:hypothetical protein